ncbi:hypothetical protein [Sphingomonas adhaesiva]|uniref:hypothetical protein n=1 Tax=Sphingomonas adhaesiva TaxID=28212 RepID=UPI002FF4EC69
MTQAIATWGTFAAALATAIATFFLWRVTGFLAIETKRMADASAQPQVVANIVLNQWAMNHADIVIENTGNATAFEIEVEFDPPLENGEVRERNGSLVPFSRISILKPGQVLSSYLAESAPLIDKSFAVSITWKVHPEATVRQALSYEFRMGDYMGMSRLGASDPAIQIAEQVKKIREDWQSVAQGQRKIRTDIFTEADRDREQRLIEERYRDRVAPKSSATMWTKLKRLLPGGGNHDGPADR